MRVQLTLTLSQSTMFYIYVSTKNYQKKTKENNEKKETKTVGFNNNSL